MRKEKKMARLAKREKIIEVILLIIAAILIFLLLRSGKVLGQELDLKCDVEGIEGKVIQDTAFDAQLYVRFPMTAIWVPAGYFQEGVRLKEIKTDEKNIVCVFGDLTLAEGLIFSESWREGGTDGEIIKARYRILWNEPRELRLELSDNGVKIFRPEGERVVNGFKPRGLQPLLAHLQSESDGVFKANFPFGKGLYVAEFSVFGREQNEVIYKAAVSPYDYEGEDKSEKIQAAKVRVKSGRIVQLEAIFNNRVKMVLTSSKPPSR